MQLTINKKTVDLHFGFDFMEEINKSSGITVNGVNVGAGAQQELGKLEMGDMAALVRVLFAATKGSSPRPSFELVRDEVFQDTGNEEADFARVDSLMKETIEVMNKSLPLRYQLNKMKKMAEEVEEKQEAGQN